MTMMDTISSLHGIICHILSFLPTKLAVTTCILSKRWYPLWRSLNILNLSDDPHIRGRGRGSHFRFVEFVYSVLLFRDATKPVKRFTLKFLNCLSDEAANEANVMKWVSFVLQRGDVEYLDLEFDRLYFSKLPFCISRCRSSCRTLVVLKLCGLHASYFDSEEKVVLPSLKIMHLLSVTFTTEELLAELLSGCPNLEDLKVIYAQSNSWYDQWVEFKSLTKLIRAEIDQSTIQFWLEGLCNVHHLSLDIDKVFPNYDRILTFYNLTHMELFFAEYRWQWLIQVLKHCRMLQTLLLREEVNPDKKLDDNWLCPEFAPECISFQLRECTIYGYKGMKDEFGFATYIMQNAGVLQTIKIYSNWMLDSNAKLKMREKLLLCKKRSATCQLSYFN